MARHGRRPPGLAWSRRRRQHTPPVNGKHGLTLGAAATAATDTNAAAAAAAATAGRSAASCQGLDARVWALGTCAPAAEQVVEVVPPGLLTARILIRRASLNVLAQQLLVLALVLVRRCTGLLFTLALG